MEKQMKTQTTTSIRSSFAKFLAAGLLTAGSFSMVQAQDSTKTPEADIRYAGTMNDKLLFGVEYKNESAQPFTVELKDADGYVFYVSRFNDKQFRKFFAIDKYELDKASIIIQLATKDGIQKQVFDVNTTSKMVQEVSVVKL
jgi:hypothetical protein